MKIILNILMASFVANAHAASSIAFTASNDAVDFGLAAPFLISGSSYTWMLWFSKTSLNVNGGSTLGRLYGTGLTTTAHQQHGLTEISAFTDRTGTDSSAITSNFSLTINTPYFIAVTYGQGDGVHIYKGTAMTPITECVYASSATGSGATVNHSANAVIVGNRQGKTAAFQNASIGPFALVNRILTTAEMGDFKTNIKPPPGTVLFAHLGFNVLGSSTVYDLSGNGNLGTTSGSSIGLSNTGFPVAIGGSPL